MMPKTSAFRYSYTARKDRPHYFFTAASSFAVGALCGALMTTPSLTYLNTPTASTVTRQGTFHEQPDCYCQYSSTNRAKLNKLVRFIQDKEITK